VLSKILKFQAIFDASSNPYMAISVHAHTSSCPCQFMTIPVHGYTISYCGIGCYKMAYMEKY
jgi:hypothetical protein